MHQPYLDELIAYDLTHVQYSPSDPWGVYWAFITLSPVLILAVYIAAFLHRRELVYVNALWGQIVCEKVNHILKARIQQPRPTDVLGRGYGMPSSHSQFSGFFAAFWALHILMHWPKCSSDVRGYTARVVDQSISLALVILTAGLTCYSRHYLLYHTPAQIVVGASLGLVFGAAYYMLTEFVPRRTRTGQAWRHWFYTTRIAQGLRLVDSWAVWTHGPADAVYSRWQRALPVPAPASTADAAGAQQAPRTTSAPAHLAMMLRALSEADHCDGVPTAFSVGCVIAAHAPQLGDLSALDLAAPEPLVLTTGYSRELPGNTHAEECALHKLQRLCARTPKTPADAADARSRDPLSLVLYTTMEPCSQRLSGNTPCTQRILEFNASPPLTTAAWLARSAADASGAAVPSTLDTTLRPLHIALVVQGVREPDDFVKCEAARMLRGAEITVATATPPASPAAAGLVCPPLSSVGIQVDAQAPTTWLEDVCLRMARKP